MKNLISFALFLSAFSASAQVVDIGELCDFKTDEVIHAKGRELSDKIARSVGESNAVNCTFSKRFKLMEFTPDHFKYKCEGTDKKIVLKVSIANEYCQPQTVTVGKYKVIFK